MINHPTYFEDIGAWPSGNTANPLWLYVSGFVLSLALTFAAYALVVNHLGMSVGTIMLLAALAAAQFFIQLIFFFHLSFEKAARERLVVFAGTVAVVAILVSGSIWILLTLNVRMMPSAEQMMQYMETQAGL